MRVHQRSVQQTCAGGSGCTGRPAAAAACNVCERQRCPAPSPTRACVVCTRLLCCALALAAARVVRVPVGNGGLVVGLRQAAQVELVDAARLGILPWPVLLSHGGARGDSVAGRKKRLQNNARPTKPPRRRPAAAAAGTPHAYACCTRTRTACCALASTCRIVSALAAHS
jgi:hypothetical protein